MTEVLTHGNISILRDCNSGKVTWQLQWHGRFYRRISYIGISSENELKETEKIAIDALLRDTAHDLGLFGKDLDGLQKQQSSLQKAVV